MKTPSRVRQAQNERVKELITGKTLAERVHEQWTESAAWVRNTYYSQDCYSGLQAERRKRK